MGAWIETVTERSLRCIFSSLPSWERGLKRLAGESAEQAQPVAPFVGAWIETSYVSVMKYAYWVAPFVGAWIETPILAASQAAQIVAPFVGAWIETSVFISTPA